MLLYIGNLVDSIRSSGKKRERRHNFCMWVERILIISEPINSLPRVFNNFSSCYFAHNTVLGSSSTTRSAWRSIILYDRRQRNAKEEEEEEEEKCKKFFFLPGAIQKKQEKKKQALKKKAQNPFRTSRIMCTYSMYQQ